MASGYLIWVETQFVDELRKQIPWMFHKVHNFIHFVWYLLLLTVLLPTLNSYEKRTHFVWRLFLKCPTFSITNLYEIFSSHTVLRHFHREYLTIEWLFKSNLQAWIKELQFHKTHKYCLNIFLLSWYINLLRLKSIIAFIGSKTNVGFPHNKL